MIVVSDTSPVANLLLINRLDILQKVFSEIILPTAVHNEIMQLHRLGRDVSAYQQASWIKIQDAVNQAKSSELKHHLDEGEAEAIALALELHCDLILIDERLGTRIARAEGLSTVGLVGVLVLAKNQELIPAIKPILSELKAKAGFWLGITLQNQILADAGEL